MSKIPYIPVTINENDINNGALEILKVIRPEWDLQNVEFKLLTDGITNKLVACRAQNSDIAETVLVRVYGNKTDLLIDRKAETRNIILLNSLNLAPDLYATFQNGLAYKFIPGCTLSDQSVTNPEIYKLVAKRMAKLHKTQQEIAEKTPFIWDKIKNFFDLVPDNFTDEEKNSRYKKIGPTKRQIQTEIDQIRQHLSETSNPVVFCHNDLLLGNVIYTKEKNLVTFIDYEYAAFNYQAFDIANHFLEFAGLENVDYTKFPEAHLQKDWIRIYLKEFQNEFTETDLNRLFVQVNKFVLLSHLFWGLWALIQTEHSYINFDFLGYAAIRFEEYFTKKDNLLALELPR